MLHDPQLKNTVIRIASGTQLSFRGEPCEDARTSGRERSVDTALDRAGQSGLGP